MTVNELKNRIIECGNNIAIVTFTKKDGSERVMKCSLNFELLEKRSDETEYVRPTKEPAFDAESRGMVRVWDVENKGWRTITAKTVSDISMEETGW